MKNAKINSKWRVRDSIMCKIWICTPLTVTRNFTKFTKTCLFLLILQAYLVFLKCALQKYNDKKRWLIKKREVRKMHRPQMDKKRPRTETLKNVDLTKLKNRKIEKEKKRKKWVIDIFKKGWNKIIKINTQLDSNKVFLLIRKQILFWGLLLPCSCCNFQTVSTLWKSWICWLYISVWCYFIYPEHLLVLEKSFSHLNWKLTLLFFPIQVAIHPE